MPAMQETRVRFLGQEDPLEEGMAAHSSILAWRIPWAEELDGPQSIVLQSRTRVKHWAQTCNVCSMGDFWSPWRCWLHIFSEFFQILLSVLSRGVTCADCCVWGCHRPVFTPVTLLPTLPQLQGKEHCFLSTYRSVFPLAVQSRTMTR